MNTVIDYAHDNMHWVHPDAWLTDLLEDEVRVIELKRLIEESFGDV